MISNVIGPKYGPAAIRSLACGSTVLPKQPLFNRIRTSIIFMVWKCHYFCECMNRSQLFLIMYYFIIFRYFSVNFGLFFDVFFWFLFKSRLLNAGFQIIIFLLASNRYIIIRITLVYWLHLQLNALIRSFFYEPMWIFSILANSISKFWYCMVFCG